MMVFETKLSEVVDAKWPTTTTGMFPWKNWGGLPVFATGTTLSPWERRKLAPVAVERMEPGTTVPSRRKVVVPNWARCDNA